MVREGLGWALSEGDSDRECVLLPESVGEAERLCDAEAEGDVVTEEAERVPRVGEQVLVGRDRVADGVALSDRVREWEAAAEAVADGDREAEGLGLGVHEGERVAWGVGEYVQVAVRAGETLWVGLAEAVLLRVGLWLREGVAVGAEAVRLLVRERVDTEGVGETLRLLVSERLPSRVRECEGDGEGDGEGETVGEREVVKVDVGEPVPVGL